ncbi:MAG: fasciclin domain-containing protein, partial [Planctomycetota bacterium]
SILKYHVVAGRAFSTDAAKLGKAPTLLGQEIRFSARDGQLYVNDAKIVAADIDASNGVIHVIDSVILPK